MCWLVVKNKGKTIPEDYMDRAQKINNDGYGVSWYEDGEINTLKTFDWEDFKYVVRELKEFPAIIHLRKSSAGNISEDNIHPFNIQGGIMYHNGTIFSLKEYKDTKSDTQKFAELINKCKYSKIEDLMPFIEHIIGDTINRLAFMEDDGTITIVNSGLGIEEDGIWYSNDYHIPPSVYKYVPTKEVVTVIESDEIDYEEDDEDTLIKKECTVDYDGEDLVKVFVYGTLKRGYGNHHILVDEPYLGTAKSIHKWAMVGKDSPFPYLLEPHDNGKYIKGELYLADNITMARLDRLEGFPYHYCYDIIEVLDEDGDIHEALVYVKTYSQEIDLEECIEEWGN